MHMRWVREWPATICGFAVVYGKQSGSAPKVAQCGHPDRLNARTARPIVWCDGHERRSSTCACTKAVSARCSRLLTQVTHTLLHACGFAHGAPPQRVMSCPAWLKLAAQLAYHADRRGTSSGGTRHDMNSRDSQHCVRVRHTATGRRRTGVEPSTRCQMSATVLACSAVGAGAVS